MTLLVCDTNVWIEASANSQSAAAHMISSARSRGFRLGVSKHSRSELAAGSPKSGPAAERLANDFEEIPYYPIGSWSELLGTIAELAGAFDDIRQNDTLREQLGSLGRQGTDIRDRGALIDALRSQADYFVTSDKGLVGAGPRTRIEASLPIRIRTPPEMVQELSTVLAAPG